MRAPDWPDRIRRREIERVATVIAKLQQRAAHLQALRALDKTAPVGAAAKLAIAHHRKSDLFLLANRVTDAFVDDVGELVVADFVAGALAECLAQRRRAQQAPHVIGAERRAAVWTNAHADGSGSS